MHNPGFVDNMLNLDNSGSVFNQDIKLQKTGIAMDRTPKCVFFFWQNVSKW